MTHLSPKRNMVPKLVLMRPGLVSLTTAKPVNTAQPRTTVNSARPMTNIFNKAHSAVRRPINNNIAFKNSNFNQRINIVKGTNVNTVRPKAVVNAARPKAVLNVVKGNQIQVSDGLGPQKRLIFLPYVHDNPQQDLKEKGDMLPLEVAIKERKSQAEFIMTLLREINEIAFVVKLLSLSWSLSCCRLVPSCFIIFAPCIFGCLGQHAHTLHDLERLLIISLVDLISVKEDLVFQSLCGSLWL
ncbi:hypothetical protein Tco_0378066 [Tanacetum coccineum]